jgi:hypothetical protein
MKRAIMAALAMLAVLVAAPLASSGQVQAAPAARDALTQSGTGLVQKAHSARWHFIRNNYGPRPYYGRPYYARPYYRRPYYARPYYRYPRHYRPYGYGRPFYGRPFRHHGWHRW